MRGSLLVACLLLAGCTQVVQPTLVVTVTAPQHGTVRPLQGARVLLSDNIHGGTTDADGQVSIYGLKPGRYNLTVDFDDQHRLQAIQVAKPSKILVELNETAKPDIAVHVMWAAESFKSASCPRPDGTTVVVDDFGRPAQPAVNATVLLSDNVHGGRTDVMGRYDFFDLPRGDYNVTVASHDQQSIKPAHVGFGPAPVIEVVWNATRADHLCAGA